MPVDAPVMRAVPFGSLVFMELLLGSVRTGVSAALGPHRPFHSWRTRSKDGIFYSGLWNRPIMDRLEAMSLVLAVAETGSLAGAARRLRTPVATASRKISDLEAHLHAKLFDRSGRKLALTDAGGTYVAAAARILADVGEAERAASGEYTAPTGELIMTAPI